MIWFFQLPLALGFTLLALVLAPILAAFAVYENGFSDNGNAMRVEPRLPSWLSWFMTPDNSLYGDGGWREEHCPNHWKDYWGWVQWLWRNSAYGFLWTGPLGAHIDQEASIVVYGNPQVRNGPNFTPGYCWVVITNPDGARYWNLCYVRKLTETRCLQFNLGWKIKTYAEEPARLEEQPRAMYVASIKLPRMT